MSLSIVGLKLTPLKLRLALIALLGVGVFVGSGAVSHAQSVEGVAAGVDFSWTLMAAFLVFFMQAGFAFLGAGLIRSKSTVNYMTKSFLDFAIAALSFWAFGFALMWGGSAAASGLSEGNAIIGYSGFFLAGEANADDTALNWIFQMVFAGTAATIIAGAIAERTRINAYLAYSFIVGAIIYPIYGHWVWGGGWLSSLDIGSGAVDFAGSGVVHAVGGVVALAAAIVVGPRIGKFNDDGTPNEIKGHNMPYVVIGTFILFFGWFGFNAGSTVAGTDLRIATIATNTLLAGAAGSVVALYVQMARSGKADLPMACKRRPGGTGWNHRPMRLRRAMGRRRHRRHRGARHDGQRQPHRARAEGRRPRRRHLRPRHHRALGPAGGRHIRRRQLLRRRGARLRQRGADPGAAHKHSRRGRLGIRHGTVALLAHRQDHRPEGL